MVFLVVFDGKHYVVVEREVLAVLDDGEQCVVVCGGSLEFYIVKYLARKVGREAIHSNQ